MIPTLVCACGCGSALPMARFRSQQVRYVNGHQNRGRAKSSETRARISIALRGRARTPEHARRLSIAKRGKRLGQQSAQHRAAISAALTGRTLTVGHRQAISRGRLARWAREDPSYQAIHKWLRRTFPKTGICARCGKAGKTDYAFLHHPLPHTRRREDYIELCNDGCHQRFDAELRANKSADEIVPAPSPVPEPRRAFDPPQLALSNTTGRARLAPVQVADHRNGSDGDRA